MKKIKILMLDLKSYYPSPAYQLGLLASYARLEPEVEKNVEFVFSEHPREERAEKVVQLILDSNADLVAASNYAWNYKKICSIFDLLGGTDAARLPRFILGGPNSEGEFGDELMRRYPILSAMVQAEGEPAFRDICSSLVDSPAQDPFVNSRNCVVRGENGEIVRPDMDHRIQSLDEIPSPYLSGLLPVDPSPIFYETNRGCPYRCSFCYWGNGNSRVYRMSHDRVREEMEYFAKNKVMAFWIADANFGIFPDDSDIAEMMAEINARHGYPFKHVGVNWAKNSSDRVLEIASIFKKGRMGCTTTLALQSVTGEAEDQMRRYSMAPSKFVNLIQAAEEQDIDTYTDVIWGLPGESVEEYLHGLDAIISTGVPSMLIHQLYLLPGTEFYDDREKFGLEMLSEAGGTSVDPSERSDYWDYIVVSHPKMPRAGMIRGTRLMGIGHLLHNHNLGRVVDFYLARYDLSHAEVYDFFDAALLGDVKELGDDDPFFAEVRALILDFSNNVGLDEFLFYRRLSDLVWFMPGENGRRSFGEPRVRAFMHKFYRALCRQFEICNSPEEKLLLREIVDYNVLISPKPAWKPEKSYSYEFDVHGIWQAMQEQIYVLNGSEQRPAKTNGQLARSNGESAKPVQITTRKQKKAEESWSELSANVRSRLKKLLTDDYLGSMQGPVTYEVKNPWLIPPSKSTSDWLLSNRSKHCIVTPAPAAVLV